MKEPVFDIKRDAKRLAVVLAIIVIPIMYSFFFLDAFWDPYSKLENLPVAVVNEDKGATINSEQKNAGNELVDELKDNKKLKWIFTNKEEAQAGLNDRKYYAVVEIPENFSANIATAETKDKLQGVVIFQPEQKRNYLASQILSKAMMELENKVSANVTKEIVQYIADENKKLPDQLTELSDGLDKMQKDGTNKLEDGLSKLVDNQVKFNAGIDKVGSGVNQLSNGFSKVGTGVNTLSGGSNTLASRQQEFANALSSSVPQFKQLADGSALFQKSLLTLNSGLLQINTGATQMSSKLPELKTGIDQYNQGLKTYTQGLKTFGEGVAPLATQLQPLKTGSDQYYSSVSTYSAKMGELDKGVSQYVGSVKTLASTNKSVAEMLTAYVKAHPEAMTDKNIQNIVAIFQKSQGSLDQLNTASDSVQKSVSALSTGSQQLVAGSKQINDGVTKFVDGAPKLSQAAAQLSTGADSLVTGGNKISTGLDTLSDGTAKMAQAVAQASDGAAKLKDGYSKIDTGIQKASGSISVAASSAGQLADGAKKLNAGVSELKNGVSQINGGISKLSSGSKELETNSQKFLDGEKELRDGAATLGDKVKEAHDKIVDKQSEANDKVAKLDGLAEYVSDPVKIDEQAVDPVDGYGTAFAPYFVSLSLWVGALIMFVMIYLNPQMRFKRKVVKNAHMDVKLLIYPALGVAQALGLGLVLINVLHLKPTDMSMFFVVTTLVSLCFISIEQFLIVHLGDVGKFLVILLLILQLTSSGGTFPNELVPKFFTVINQFMPMTYSIYALKETISGHNSAFLNQNIMVLAIIMVIFLVASLLLTGRKKARSIDDIESDFVHKRESNAFEG